MTLNKFAILSGALGVVALFGAPATAQEGPAAPQACSVNSPGEIVVLIDAALGQATDVATGPEIEALIENAIPDCADPVDVTVALGTVAAENFDNSTIVGAATAVASGYGEATGGATGGGATVGGGNPTPPPASQGGGGGNSDY